MNKIPELLSQQARGLRPSATLLINERSQALQKEGRKIYRFGFGQSPFPVPPSVVDALSKNAFRKDYLPVAGLFELREAVAEFHRRRHGLSCTWEDVLVAPGSKELLFLIQMTTTHELLIPSPSWVSYVPQAQLSNKAVKIIPAYEANNWLITAEDLERVCVVDQAQPKIIILNYPSNPAGSSFTERQLIDIALVARKFGLIIVSDEIYGEVDHEGSHISISKFYPEGTVVSSGLSKWCGAGGWRLGTFIFPKEMRWLREAMAIAASETYTSASAPIQHAAVEAFRFGGGISQYVQQSRSVLKAVGMFTFTKLQKANVTMPQPAGGFYLFPNFSNYVERIRGKGIKTSTDFCNQLLNDTGVALLPGHDFGRPPEEFTARLSYVDFDGAQALTKASTKKTIRVGEVAPNVVEGISALINWLGAL